jgi:hypothetical protein
MLMTEPPPDLPKLFRVALRNRSILRTGAARIIVKNIEPAKPSQRRLERGCHTIRLAAMNKQRIAVHRSHFIGSRGAGLVIDLRQNNFCAFRRKPKRRGTADSETRSVNERHFARQARQRICHVVRPCCFEYLR